jgi:thiol:disulfide interchange protein
MKAFRYSRKYVCSALAAVLFLFFSSAFALESAAVISPRAHVTIISNDDAIEPGKSFYLGLRFQLTQGWHVYWLNPGDAGQPPALHLQAPNGVTNSGIEWPTPVRLLEGPAMVYAYTGDITLPVKVTVPASFNQNELKLAVDADWLVCADRCIPEKGHFEISIPVGTQKISSEALLIDASLARIPKPSPFTTHITAKGSMIVKDVDSAAVQDAWFFPDKWGMVEHAAAQKLIVGDKEISLELKPGLLYKPDTALSGILVLKNTSGSESFYTVTATPEAATPATVTSWSDWLRTLLFALLGGLILNLMPCVLPVLAIKALAIANHSNSERAQIRIESLFYTLGVLVAFATIALLLLVVRTAGLSVGWGFQFQSPVFVTFMSWLMLAIGLNLSGVYMLGARMMGMGDSYARKKGNTGSFFTGLLAVVVATPCVAPFMGAAIATALLASPTGILTIFLAMGLGLALPYILLAIFPSAARILPRPGMWMETLKQALAFPMYAASAWLLWVLSQQDGAPGLAYALGGFILIALAAWLVGQVNYNSKCGQLIRNGFVIAALLSVCILLYGIAKMPMMTTGAVTHKSINEEAFTEQRLAELQAAGKPVFVDMTAAWCITCLVNERVALEVDSVQAAFAKNQIVYLKGDWTQQDPAITRFLEQHNSDGVPLYVFYPANHGTPAVLPQILTPSIVLNVIDKSKT